MFKLDRKCKLKRKVPDELKYLGFHREPLKVKFDGNVKNREIKENRKRKTKSMNYKVDHMKVSNLIK